MLSIDRISSMEFKLYQAAKKHSSFTQDCIKLREEFEEFYNAVCYNDGDSCEEFADLLRMMYRIMFYDKKPMSEQHAQHISYSALEYFESKFDRQMNERGWSK